MNVHVIRTRTVPSGTVTIEDVYDGTEITGINIRFSGRDLKEGFDAELSEAITRQARRWVERGTQPGAVSGPITVTVQRRKDLPGDTRVVIEDDAEHVIYLFDEDVITEEGAHAFQRMLTGRTATWVRRDDVGDAASR